MKFRSIRQLFKPLFGSDHGELIARFLNAIVTSVIVIDTLVIVSVLLDGGHLLDKTSLVLLSLLALQFILLFMLRRGIVTGVAIILIFSAWSGVTYLVWHADGIHDVALFVYVLIILMSALLVSWRISLLVTVLSITTVWIFALAESRGLRTLNLDSPLHFARDLTAIFTLFVFMIFLVINTLRQTLEKMQVEFAERSRAEQALQKSEERFRKVFQSSPVAIVITTLAEGRMIDANEAYWRLSGHDPKSSIGRTTFELRNNLHAEERNDFVHELLEKRSLQRSSYDFVNEAGRHLKTSAFYELIDEAGTPAILSMFYDITEQNDAREALIQSEARVRALLEATPDMIFELTRDGTIIQYIPSAEHGLFLPPQEFIGKPLAHILPSIAEQANFAIGRALDSGQVNAFEYQLPSGEELKDYEARITPAGPNLVLATVRDISLRKWAESERDKLIDELESKNAELERFTYTVSHDLKSPLITIKGFLGYVREDVRIGNMERFEADLRRIGDAADKMQHLLGDLLELSRIGRLTNEPVYIPMNELIAEVLELLHGRISAGNIVVNVAENLPLVYGDRQRLFEVFQNLIDNAAKFIADQPAPQISIGTLGELNGKPIFFVRDNGIGIAPQFKDKIFGLFDKLNAQSDGTGIGLALVKRIVEFHKGQIWVESELGKGATFFLSLPTQPEAGDVNQ